MLATNFRILARAGHCILHLLQLCTHLEKICVSACHRISQELQILKHIWRKMVAILLNLWCHKIAEGRQHQAPLFLHREGHRGTYYCGTLQQWLITSAQ